MAEVGIGGGASVAAAPEVGSFALFCFDACAARRTALLEVLNEASTWRDRGKALKIERPVMTDASIDNSLDRDCIFLI